MESMTQRQKRALETKEKIFKASIELFKEFGFENVHINDIAKRTGTAKGTLYTHFKSKEHVVVEHYKGIDQHYELVYQKLPSTMPCYEKLMAIFKEGFLFTEEIGKELLRVVLISQISGKEDIPYVMDKNRKIYNIVEEIITDGQTKGEFTKDINSYELVLLILQQYSGIFMRWCLLDEEVSLCELGLRSTSLVLDGIRRTS